MNHRNKTARPFHCVEFPRAKFFGKFLSVLVLVALVSFSLWAAPGSTRRQGIEYRWSAMPVEEARRQVLLFHRVFIEESERQYRRYGLQPPRQQQVFLAADAADFRKVTGQKWFVAGTYDPRANRFYFQNPGRLRARNILRTTIVHEICHQLVRRSRPAEQVRWLEESFCEALSATAVACTNQSAAINRQIRRARQVADLRRMIELKSSRGAAARGHCLARIFGRHLIARYGERAMLRAFTREGEAVGRATEAFPDFKRKFE